MDSVLFIFIASLQACVLETEKLEFESQLCTIQVRWPWVSYVLAQFPYLYGGDGNIIYLLRLLCLFVFKWSGSHRMVHKYAHEYIVKFLYWSSVYSNAPVFYADEKLALVVKNIDSGIQSQLCLIPSAFGKLFNSSSLWFPNL